MFGLLPYGKQKLVFYAYTPFQFYIMSFIAYKIKEDRSEALVFLIAHPLLEKTMNFFDLSFWDDIFYLTGDKISTGIGGWYYLLSPSRLVHVNKVNKWYIIRKKEVKEIKEIVHKLDRIGGVNVVLFSSGDQVAVSILRTQFPKAIFACIGEGSVAYYQKKIIKTRLSYVPRVVKTIYRHVINMIFSLAFSDNEQLNWPICGGNDVNVFIDLHPRIAINEFSLGKLVYQIGLDDLKNYSDKLIAQNLKSVINEINGDNVVILLTQRLSEDGFISENDELEFYTDIIKFFREKGMKIYIKSHPRESRKKIERLKQLCNIKTLDNLKGIPFEVIALQIKVRCLISIVSSAMLNAYESNTAVIYVNMNRVLAASDYKLSGLDFTSLETEKSLLHEGNGVFLPNDWDEFKKIDYY